jgi:integrase
MRKKKLANALPKRALRSGAKAPYIVQEKEILPGKLKIVRTRDGGSYWYSSLYIPKPEQRIDRKSTRTTNEDDAAEIAIARYFEIQRRIKTGESIAPISVKEMARRFLAEEEKRVFAGGRHDGGIKIERFGTIRTYVKHMVEFLGADTRLDKLQPEKFADYLLHRRAKATSVERVTIKNEITIIRKALKFAIKRNLLRRDFEPEFPVLPANTQPHSDRPEGTRDYFDAADWADLYKRLTHWDEEVSDPKEKYDRTVIFYFLSVLYRTGLRTSELRNARWEDIEFDTTRADGSVIIKIGRLRKSGARKAIAIEARELFRDLKGFATHTKPDDYLFANRETGRPFSRRKIYDLCRLAIEPIAKKTKKKLSAYSLRTTYCSMRAAEGMPPAKLARVMGVKVAVMEKHYMRFNIEDLRKELVERYDQHQSKQFGIDIKKVRASLNE